MFFTFCYICEIHFSNFQAVDTCACARTQSRMVIVVELRARVEEDWSSRRRNVRSLIYWTFLHISAHSSAPHTQGVRHKRQSSRSQRAQPDRSKLEHSKVTAAAAARDIISVCRRFDPSTSPRDGEDTSLNLQLIFHLLCFRHGECIISSLIMSSSIVFYNNEPLIVII